MKIFWDTNIWVYLFDASSPRKQDAARRLLKENHGRIITSTQVLQEFYVTVTRKLERPLGEADAAEALRALSEFCTVSPDIEMIFAAAHLSRHHSVSFWDALIIEASISGGAKTLCTEDLQNGQVFGSLTIENPF